VSPRRPRRGGRAALAGAALVAGAIVADLAGCGVAPIREGPGPPTTTEYHGPHGRPRAFGGGVCPLTTRHAHPWPPVPAEAFVQREGAWRDTRRIVALVGPHPLDGGRCERTGWHQHALP
jgi:hypothetical protein